MIRRLLTATALVAGLALPARAEDPAPEPAAPGTAEGAAALRASLAAYLTQMPFESGLLRIEPDPAGQRITLDPAPLLRDYAGGKAEVAPLSFLVSPRADGDWNVFSRDPLDLRFETTAGEAAATFASSQASQVFKGVFAPGLLAYRTVESTARDTVVVQADGLSDARTTLAGTRISMGARPGADGGVDIDFSQTLTGYAQSISVKAPPPPADGVAPDGTPEAAGDAEARALAAAFMNVAIEAREVETVAAVKDARNVEVADLYALVLRHADAIETDGKAALAGPFGEELRAAILKVLPVWTSLDVAGTVRDASFRSPFVTLSAGEAKQATRMTGAAENAGFETDISVRDMSVDGALLPPWASGFLPKEAVIGVSISGLDLKTPADLAVRNADFTADEPFSEEAKARILSAFDPERITVALKPSVVRAADLELHLSGHMGFVDGKPAGTLTARASNLARTIESLQRAAADQPDLHQVVGMVQMAQGLGRQTADGDWEWVVDAAADGSVSVNGSMLKGPDPVDEPGSDLVPDDEAGPETGTAFDRL